MDASKRRGRDQRIIKRRKKTAAWMGYPSKGGDNRWNKFSCGGCANPQCYICHPEKVGKKKKRDEIEVELDELDMEEE